MERKNYIMLTFLLILFFIKINADAGIYGTAKSYYEAILKIEPEFQ